MRSRTGLTVRQRLYLLLPARVRLAVYDFTSVFGRSPAIIPGRLLKAARVLLGMVRGRDAASASMPLRLQVEVTDRCNFDCIMCNRLTRPGIDFKLTNDIDAAKFAKLLRGEIDKGRKREKPKPAGKVLDRLERKYTKVAQERKQVRAYLTLRTRQKGLPQITCKTRQETHLSSYDPGARKAVTHFSRADCGTVSKRSSTDAYSGRVSSWKPPATS